MRAGDPSDISMSFRSHSDSDAEERESNSIQGRIPVAEREKQRSDSRTVEAG